MSKEISKHDVTYHAEDVLDRSRAHNEVYIVYLPDRIGEIGIEEGDQVHLDSHQDESGLSYLRGAKVKEEDESTYKIRTGSSTRLRVTLPADYRDEFIEQGGDDIFVVEINPLDSNEHFRIYKNSDYPKRIEYLNRNGKSPQIGQPVLLSLSSEILDPDRNQSQRENKEFNQSSEDLTDNLLGFAGGKIGPVTITEVHLRRSLMRVLTDVLDPVALPESQFIFLTISLTRSDAAIGNAESFQLLLDDTIYTGTKSIGGAKLHRPIQGLSYNNEEIHPPPKVAAENNLEQATVGFEVPLNIDPDQAIIQWRGEGETARLPWNEFLIDALRNPPEFRVIKINSPRVIDKGEPFDISITIANDGGREAEFNAVVPIVRPVKQDHPIGFSIDVPASGESKWEGTFQYPPKRFTQVYMNQVDKEAKEITYQLDWALGTQKFSVYVGD